MTIPLLELLRRPGLVEAKDAFRRLTGGDNLFQSLLAEVKAQEASRQSPPEFWRVARAELERWNRDTVFGVELLPIREPLLRLIDCAELAAREAASGLDHETYALTSPGHAVSRDSDRGWIATLRGAGPHKGPVEVPIALWKKEQKEGILGTLQLEVVPGSGEAYLHPKDALATIIDQDFKGAMRDAWAAACERVRADGADVEGLAGRFRVVRNGTPIPDVEGNSAAGAAALGWFLALRNMVPDEGIIIMTNVVHVGIGYKPSGVGGIKEKVRAIASDGRFDTIVVGSGENQDEAEKNLAGNDHIRVLLATEL